MIAASVAALDWPAIAADLDTDGYAVVSRLMEPEQCRSLAVLYPQDGLFRKRIDMARHGYGRGTYGYFAYPLPDPVTSLRAALYPPLADVANRWNVAMGFAARYPATHADFLDVCHGTGQVRPTPLILRYGPGDYNRLHQDLYGEHVFPLQVAVLLSSPGDDFTGGEFVLTEQRARMQSRAEVVPLGQGDAVIFAVRHHPVHGPNGAARVVMRHGVSRLRSGERLTLGESSSMTQPDLLEPLGELRAARESLGEGAVLLRGFARETAGAMIAAVADIAAAAPFRNMVTPGGFAMSVAMTNCGSAGWVTDRRGYRYDPTDPESGRSWPVIPPNFRALAERAAGEAGFPDFRLDSCLINRYEPGARLSLHRDENERDFTQPIVSVSLGLPAIFLFGSPRRADRPRRITLAHGDVVVWGGSARLNFHGVAPLADGDHPATGCCRINLTFRRAL